MWTSVRVKTPGLCGGHYKVVYHTFDSHLQELYEVYIVSSRERIPLCFQDEVGKSNILKYAREFCSS